MKFSGATTAVLCAWLVAGAVTGAVAQSRPPGGAPPPPPMPSGPRTPGGVSQPGGMSGPGFPRMPDNNPSRPRGGPGPGTSPSAASPNSRNPVQFGPVGRWWDDRQVVHAIGLRTEQQRKMDSIFNANKPALVDSYKAYLQQKAKLDSLSKQDSVDKSAMFAAIDSVNEARANLEKTTAQMLLEIRQQMDPEQIQKLEQLK